MLSILIPTYNYNCLKLVQDLQNQCTKLDIPFEILVMDDCSTNKPIENKRINSLNNCKYIELSENIGRSKIRNKLASEAQYNHFLFIDCDAQLQSPNFIQRYLSFCKEEAIVCGGTAYDRSKEQNDNKLRLFYGISREARNASIRQQHPYGAFSSFNFLISRNLFEQVKFNENIKGYGHEDTMFGYQLKKNNFIIYHIENNLIHLGLEDSATFIDKTKTSIQNLLKISKMKDGDNLTQDIKLYSNYKRIKKLGLKTILKFFFLLFRNRMELNLKGKKPSLFIFDIYKLSYLCRIS